MSSRIDSLIPQADLSAFGRLHDDCKKEVLILAKAMREIQASTRTTHALCFHASRLRTNYPKLRRLYYGDSSVGREGWLQAGWRALVDQRKYGTPGARVLPQSFVDYWLEVRVQHQREQTAKSAHDAVCEQWRKWTRDPFDQAVRIPGYDAPPKPDPFTGLPPGWSYENLIKYELPKLSAAALRQGRNAALAWRAPMITSRVGLKVGAILQFDDQEYDNSINFLGVNRKLQRTLG